jgi:hypothetical protein
VTIKLPARRHTQWSDYDFFVPCPYIIENNSN